MAKAKKLHIEVSLPVSILKEGRYFVAHTPALDLSTSGGSFEEVKRRFGEVVQIFFEELLEKGTLEEVLSDLGWRKVQKRWIPPVVVAQESESFRIPLSV
jgi:predicted RNase H-like HicB family nuclease